MAVRAGEGDSMKSTQSEASSVKSNQSGPSTRKLDHLGVGKQVSNQVLAKGSENTCYLRSEKNRGFNLNANPVSAKNRFYCTGTIIM